ncbi:MAG: glycosyltransferase [Terrimonas sp.]|nr:glycosyltransferase [Terrimonas sp.]
MVLSGDNTQTIQGRDIVVISIQPWYYELGSNCKNIATEFAKSNRVLYVNIPITRKTYHSNKKSAGIEEHCRIIKEKKGNIKKISENLWQVFPTAIIESINWIPSTLLFKSINTINNHRFAKDIAKAIAELGFTNVILFNDNDIYNGFLLKKILNPSLYIYYMRDFLQGYKFWEKHASVLEPSLIKEADLVVTNSVYYQQYCSRFNQNSFYVGQGCSFDYFDYQKSYEPPPEINLINKPIIGYVGALDSSRLDINIIEFIAKHNSKWSIVLVGPEDENFKSSNLHEIKNIYFLGRKDLSQLAAFIRQFDVCINPQQINPITNGNYPLKIDEYLALGKPVVATKTKAMEVFENFTKLALTKEAYPELIESSLLENAESKAIERVLFAKSHSWENSVHDIYKAISIFI